MNPTQTSQTSEDSVVLEFGKSDENFTKALDVMDRISPKQAHDWAKAWNEAKKVLSRAGANAPVFKGWLLDKGGLQKILESVQAGDYDEIYFRLGMRGQYPTLMLWPKKDGYLIQRPDPNDDNVDNGKNYNHLDPCPPNVCPPGDV